LATFYILHSQEVFVHNIMLDICRIAEARGHHLPEDIIDRNIKNTYTMPPYKTSMLLDFENGHPMETEAILGNAVRAARQTGISSPYLDSVYALMKLRELELDV
jgi:2-dehydropantoate 2-reductase